MIHVLYPHHIVLYFVLSMCVQFQYVTSPWSTNTIGVQWVDHYFGLLVLDSRYSKHKLEVTRLGPVVQNRSQKMYMKK
jgi:hypothetical protein